MSIHLTLGQKLLFDLNERIEKKRKIGYATKSQTTTRNYSKKEYAKIPSVMVKIVSKGKQDNLYAAFRYITQENKNEQEQGENGSLKLENQNGEMMNFKDIIKEYKPSMTKRVNGKDFYHMVLSTKETAKNEKLVREAVKKTLRNQFGDKGFDYSFIAHTDTDNLHYHIIINKNNKVMKNTLDVNKEILYNTRKQFADELNVRDFNYKELESLTKEQIYSLNKNETTRRSDTIYKYQIKKIQELKQDNILKNYQIHLDDLTEIRHKFDKQNLVINNLNDKLKTGLNNKKINREEFKKKHEITAEKRKSNTKEFKTKSKTVYEKSRLIYNTINSSFFILNRTIKTNNEKISKLGMFKFGKSSISIDYNKIVEELIKNYNIKEKLYKVLHNKSNNSYEFDKEKNEEYKKTFDAIDTEYIDKNLAKEILEIKSKMDKIQLEKDNQITLLNNTTIKDLIQNHDDWIKDKKIDISNKNSLDYNIKIREKILKRTETFVFKSEENKSKLEKLEKEIKEYQEYNKNINNNKVEKILSYVPKFELDKSKISSIKFYYKYYDDILKKIKKLDKTKPNIKDTVKDTEKEVTKTKPNDKSTTKGVKPIDESIAKINDENIAKIRAIRLLKVEMRKLRNEYRNKSISKPRKFRYNKQKEK